MTPDVAVVIPLNNPLGPADDTVTAPLCSTSTSTSTLSHNVRAALATVLAPATGMPGAPAAAAASCPAHHAQTAQKNNAVRLTSWSEQKSSR